jgi:hypothetical protein
MKKYKTPDEYYYRLHHVRSRFKGDIENVLLFIATEISKLPDSTSSDYIKKLNHSIRTYPGNKIKTEKTIDNWRTEIAALFAFYVECKNGTTITGLRAKELAEKQDLVEMFKKFLFLFQYPGAHIKSDKVLKMIGVGIHFKPAQYILKILQAGEAETGSRVYLSREEVCHCIFNDLRCTRDNENPQITWGRILTNRKSNCHYDKTGDVIRYAGDILDYMVIANLLNKDERNRFYLNSLETDIIQKFINSTQWFNGYDSMIIRKSGSQDLVRHEEENWFKYANLELNETDFETNLLAFISSDLEGYKELKETGVEALNEFFDDKEAVIDTKAIGDIGESLVYSHECQRVKTGGRKDLIHLIKRIPTQLAVGYDIQSIELDERKRYIEVKTTISSMPLSFYKIHLTTNEWNTAGTLKDRYFIYRLSLNKRSQKLFIIQDPVGLYKKDDIQMIPRNGAEVIFNKKAGTEEELLLWTN